MLPRDFLAQAARHPLVSPAFPTDVGYFPHAQYHYRERAMGCGQHILIFCAGGKGFVQAGNKHRIIQKNEWFLIPQNVPHAYGSDGADPWSICWVHFDGMNAPHFWGKNTDTLLFAPVTPEKAARIRLLFEEMMDGLDSGYTFDSMVYLSQVLCSLLGYLFFSGHASAPLERKTGAVETAIAIMNKHIGGNFTLQELAGASNLSATYFSHLFKEKTGFSVIGYFNRLKIQKACQYLDITNLPIHEISARVGFHDPYYFSRAFHKVMQMPPNEYRKIKKG